MRTATAENFIARPFYARGTPSAAKFGDAVPVTTPACIPKTHEEPLARVAALLISISRNNSYEGRDPSVMPDALTSGFVADLLGIEIDELATLLVDLNRRGLVETCGSTLKLKDIPALEHLAD
jgi:Crp-like helix-turn-helix protein